MAGACECGYEPSCSMKLVEFRDYLKTCYILMKYYAHCSLFVGWLVGCLFS